MSKLIIEGDHKLTGSIEPQGAKNEALQVISATLLTSAPVRITNIPEILDVRNLILLLEKMGVKVTRHAMMKADKVSEPRNLEEQALSLIGKDVYEKLIKHYTEKQWGRKCTELPPFIIRRLPVRLNFDNNYFNDSFQGIPEGGYNRLIDGLLAGSDVKLGVDFAELKQSWREIADKIGRAHV